MLQLNGLWLGDLIRFPGGQTHTVRSVVQFPAPRGSLSGFVVCGEMELVLSFPHGRDDVVGLCHRVPGTVPDPVGVVRLGTGHSYWVPPNLGGVVGGLIGWELWDVPGVAHPVIAVSRRREVTRFRLTDRVPVVSLQHQALSREQPDPRRAGGGRVVAARVGPGAHQVPGPVPDPTRQASWAAPVVGGPGGDRAGGGGPGSLFGDQPGPGLF